MDKKIALIVEDNPLLARMFARALNDIHFETLIIGDGQQAMDWLTQKAPDLLFLDMHLPLLSGDQILERIHGEKRFSQTFIVIITADARLGEAVSDKADFLLNKPVDIRELQQLANRLKNGKN
jgi:CheY-like chemotaxis protein